MNDDDIKKEAQSYQDACVACFAKEFAKLFPVAPARKLTKWEKKERSRYKRMFSRSKFDPRGPGGP